MQKAEFSRRDGFHTREDGKHKRRSFSYHQQIERYGAGQLRARPRAMEFRLTPHVTETYVFCFEILGQAILFVTGQHDDELWGELINQSLNNAEMVLFVGSSLTIAPTCIQAFVSRSCL